MKQLTAALVAALACIATPLALAQGYIIPNGVTPVPYGSYTSFQVLQNPTNGNYTDFIFYPQVSGLITNTFLFDKALDGGVRVCFVSANSPVTAQAIQSDTYTELLFPNTYLFDDGIPFYLGLYAGPEFSPPGPYSNPLFGWAQLVNNGGVIDLLGSALTFGADGIYAGTQNIIQPVPEPGTFSLVGLGLLALGWHFRRQSSQ